VNIEEIAATSRDRNAVVAWDDGHRYTPAPRHRRRILLRIMEGLDFQDVLDAGCAQPFLIGEIVSRFAVDAFGCDVSDQVVAENRRAFPGCQFETLDLTSEVWPDSRRFDLVVCSEVLEHLDDWRAALSNLVKMSRKHLLITVPGGPLRTMDRMVGHERHFPGPELVEALEALGCKVERQIRWGWPLHSAYKAAISRVSPSRLYESFSAGKPYGLAQKVVSELLFLLFHLNDLFEGGEQLIVHARPPLDREGISKHAAHSAVSGHRYAAAPGGEDAN
jgi:SAM-dependent methyltransferase